jgi:hypothetical protein
MHESVRDNEPTQAPPDPSGAAPAPVKLLDDIAHVASAIKRLFGAQLALVAAELGLARSAVSWMFVAALVATIAGVGFGLTLLGLIGVLLAHWFNSWAWALFVMTLLQLLSLIGAIVFFRRCMHWMTLPRIRQEWRDVIRETVQKAESETVVDKVAEQAGGQS